MASGEVDATDDRCVFACSGCREAMRVKVKLQKPSVLPKYGARHVISRGSHQAHQMPEAASRFKNYDYDARSDKQSHHSPSNHQATSIRKASELLTITILQFLGGGFLC